MSVQNCGWDIGDSIDPDDFLQLTGNQTMTIAGEKTFGPNPNTVSEPTLPSQMLNANNIVQYSEISPLATTQEGVSNIDIDNLCVTGLLSGVWTYVLNSATTTNVQQMIISISDNVGNVLSQSTVVLSTEFVSINNLITMTGFIDVPTAGEVSMSLRCITALGDNYTLESAQLTFIKNQPVLGLFV